MVNYQIHCLTEASSDVKLTCTEIPERKKRFELPVKPGQTARVTLHLTYGFEGALLEDALVGGHENDKARERPACLLSLVTLIPLPS